MAKKLIITDWNGTCFRYTGDREQNSRIGYAVAREEVRRFRRGKFRKGVTLGLFRAKFLIEFRNLQYRRGKISLEELYGPFNTHVLKGLDTKFVKGAIDRFAKESCIQVDDRVLGPLLDAKLRGHSIGLMSGSIDYTIEKVLEGTGYGKGLLFSDRRFVFTNKINQARGVVDGFTSGIHGEKGKLMERVISRGGFRPRDIFYIGDTDDDLPAAGLLPRGNFIVSFMAEKGFRDRAVKEWGAFAPKTREELEGFLC